MKKLFLLLFTIATCQLTFAQDSTTILNNIGDSYFIDQYNSGDSLATTAIENSNAVQNIWLPDDSSGAIPTDIYYVGGVNKIYVYGKRNIIVIDASTNEKLARIPVSGFSQYYPTIENTQYLNYNHFAYNPKNGLLYCILEDASVIAINTANDSWQVVIPTLLVCGNNEYYNYFIKYDERLNRIYFVVSSSATNELFVYRTSDYSSVGDIAFVDPPENIRGLEINKYENEFYLSINKRFVRYTYDPDDIISETTVTKTTIGSYNQENKAGNILYVYNEENNLNKLFCFPNRYNSSGTSNYYILDIDDKSVDVSQCPSEVTAACYDGSGKVYLAYKSDNTEPDLKIIDVNDYSTITDINTHNSGINTSNNTIDISKSGNSIILGKESEVTSVDPNNNYSVTQLKKGVNNYFSRIALANNKANVIGTWSGSVDVFDQNGTNEETIEIGGAIYFACQNQFYHKIYFYNKHNQDHAKIYVLDTQTDEISIVELESKINDVVINPIDHNVLVSTENNNTKIKVIDGLTNALLPESQWLDIGYGFIGNMFISSESQKLYCIIGKENGADDSGIGIWQLSQNGITPVAFQAYPLSSGGLLTGVFTSTNGFVNYTGSQYVFAALDNANDDNFGIFTRINDDTYSHEDCQIHANSFDIVANQEDTRVYIAHNNSAHEVTSVYYSSTPLTPLIITLPDDIFDIECNTVAGYVYVLHRDQTNTFNVISKMFRGTLSVDLFNGLPKYSSAMKYNPGNSMIYLLVPFTDEGCVTGSGGIYEILDDTYGTEHITFYKDGGKQRFHYNGNIILPLNMNIVIDDETHRLYYGGGGHSCINTFQLSTFYQIALRYPYTWLSVPRHLRTTSPQLTPTSTVFAQENITNGYDYLKLDYNYIYTESGPPYPNQIVSATWDNIYFWQYENDIMNEINSTRGYKLEIHQSNPPQSLLFLDLKGTVQDPFTKMDLYCHEDNWIGYFLYEEQNVFDALADIEPDIYHIMAQDFVCYRYHYPISEDCNSKSTNDYPPGTWICDNTPNIKFGDMIIVKPDRDISNFQWNFAGNPPSTFNRPDVVYYSFDEKASYSTFVMELDTTTDNPQEIGAFVNDTCVGACSVVEQDSVVVLKAYLSQQPGDSVVFEEHYVSKSTNNYRISDYYVLNPDNKIKEKRVIKTGEDRDIFIISFGNSNKKEQNSLTDLTLNIFPNPASGAVTIEYITEREGTVKIVIFNSMGKMVKSFAISQQNKGSHTMKWNVTGENGKKLKPGLYLVSLSFQDQTVSKKIVLNN